MKRPNSLFQISVLILTGLLLQGCELPELSPSSGSSPTARLVESPPPSDDGTPGGDDDNGGDTGTPAFDFASLQGKSISSTNNTLTFVSATQLQDPLCGGLMDVQSVTEASGVITIEARYNSSGWSLPSTEDCMITVSNRWYYPLMTSSSPIQMDAKIWPYEITYEAELLSSGAIAVRRSTQSRLYQRNNVGVLNFSRETGSISEELFYE